MIMDEDDDPAPHDRWLIFVATEAEMSHIVFKDISCCDSNQGSFCWILITPPPHVTGGE